MKLLEYLLIFLLIGAAPVYFLLQRYAFDKRTELITTLLLAPVVIVVVNTINVLFGIQHSFLRFMLPFAATLATLYSIWKTTVFRSAVSSARGLARPVAIGTAFGIAYWFIAFYNHRQQGMLYADVVWNLGWVAEFRNHFPPSDPHWQVNQVMIYHYFTDMFMAGMSNLSGMDVLETMHVTNLVCSGLLFVILAVMFSEVGTLASLTLMILALNVNFANEWIGFDVLQAHMSGAAASTFYWSLPLVFALIFIRNKLDRWRLVLPHLTVAGIAFASVLIVFFAKGSFIVVFILLEFYSFVRFSIEYRLNTFDRIKANFVGVLKFVYYPLSAGLLFLIFSSWGDTMFVGVESRDFAAFESWNILWPLMAVYVPVILTLVLNFREARHYRFEYLFVSGVCLAMFYVMKHSGNSDMYFAFTAVLVNALFLIDHEGANKLSRYILAMLVTGVIFALIVNVFPVKGLHSFRFDPKKLWGRTIYGNNTKDPEIQECLRISDGLPIDALVAVPRPGHVKDFIYSAFLGRRMWNENNVYQPNLFSRNYYPIYLYFKSQDFLPDDLPDTPRANSFSKAVAEFKEKIRFDTIQFREYDNRFALYEQAAFGAGSFELNDSLARANGWTHLLIKPSDTARRNAWVRSLEPVAAQSVFLYKCNQPASE